jgi:hypothetical protein
VKSTQVYSLLKTELSGWFKNEGFKYSKGLLSWQRQHGAAYTLVWCQISQDGFDAYSGSRFTVEFQRSVAPTIGGPGQRERIAKFLSPHEKEDVRKIQNQVIARLQRPPSSYPLLHVSKEVTRIYLSRFEQDKEPYHENLDIWFRYFSPADVSAWGQFILSKIPHCIKIVEAWE